MEPPLMPEIRFEWFFRTAHGLRGIGIDDRPVGVSFGSDASKLAQIGIPSIILGPGGIDHAYKKMRSGLTTFLAYRELMRVFK